MVVAQDGLTKASVTISCELCIIGAGIAGLNALFAASRYLGKHDKVVLVDQKPEVGGMWTQTYDYVRLHQPYPMFTAGNIPWTLDKPRSYLATKQEVLRHFQHCLDTLRQRVALSEYFGYSYDEHREMEVDGDWQVDIRCHRISDRNALYIVARRCVKAFGFDIPQNPPLTLSSRQVESVSPHDAALLGSAMRESDKPIFIIGGGKSAMDTAHTLIEACPGRRINMLIGQGCMFWNRNSGFPTGLKRWFGGAMPMENFIDCALRFRGDNGAEVFDYLRETQALHLNENPRQFRLGIISEEEMGVIRAGVHDVLERYLANVADEEGQPVMQFRNGERRPIEAGSWIVNCTGYLNRHHDHVSYEPYLSANGAVVSVNSLSSVFYLPSFAAYFLVQLLYLSKLADLRLYQINFRDLDQQDSTVWPIAAVTQFLHNTLLIMQAVPIKVMQDCGLDFNLWYPLPRRIPVMIRLLVNRQRYLDHCRIALDRLRETQGIECGPLPSLQRRIGEATA